MEVDDVEERHGWKAGDTSYEEGGSYSIRNDGKGKLAKNDDDYYDYD